MDDGRVDQEGLQGRPVLGEVRLDGWGAAESQEGVRGRDRGGELASWGYDRFAGLVILATPVVDEVSL